MEKLDTTPLGEYLNTAFALQPERTLTTFSDLEEDEEILGSEILCTQTKENVATAKRVGKTALLLGERTIPFSQSEVRVLNSLLINQGMPLCTPEIQKITDRGKTVVHHALGKLVDKLCDANGERLIKQASVVMPQARQSHMGYFLESDFTVGISERQGTEKPTREEPLSRILSAYQNTPDLQGKIGVKKSRELQGYAAMPQGLQSRSYETLKPNDFYSLYDIIDKGVEAFSAGEDLWQSEISSGVLAWHSVYYSSLGLVRSQLRSFEMQSQLYAHHDDLLQAGAIELWRATLRYDSNRASFPYYAIRRIAGGFSRVAASIASQKTHTIHLETALTESHDDSDRTIADTLSVSSDIEDIPMRFLHDSLAAYVVNHPLLRASEKLVLSLYFGVYSSELDGIELDTKDNKRLVYDSGLSRNLIFRDGLSQDQIATIVRLSHTQVYRIWKAGMAKARDIGRTKAFTDLDYENFRKYLSTDLSE